MRLDVGVDLVGEIPSSLLQLDFLLLARVDETNLGADLGREQLDHVVADSDCVAVTISPCLHEEADDVGRGAVDLGTEVEGGGGALDHDDLALGDRCVLRACTLGSVHRLELFTHPATTTPLATRRAPTGLRPGPPLPGGRPPGPPRTGPGTATGPRSAGGASAGADRARESRGPGRDGQRRDQASGPRVASRDSDRSSVGGSRDGDVHTRRRRNRLAARGHAAAAGRRRNRLARPRRPSSGTGPSAGRLAEGASEATFLTTFLTRQRLLLGHGAAGTGSSAGDALRRRQRCRSTRSSCETAWPGPREPC